MKILMVTLCDLPLVSKEAMHNSDSRFRGFGLEKQEA